MKRPYKNYMPQPKPIALVQAKIDADLRDRITKVLDKEGWTWAEFMTGLFNKYLDDRKDS